MLGYVDKAYFFSFLNPKQMSKRLKIKALCAIVPFDKDFENAR